MEIYCVMVVDFQPRGREDFSAPDGWRFKRKIYVVTSDVH